MGKREKALRLGAILISAVFACAFLVMGRKAMAAQNAGVQGDLRWEYEAYRNRLEGIRTRDAIGENGFGILEEQVFEVTLENLGDVFFLPALDETYHRLALFFSDADGKIFYSTDCLEIN